MQRSFVPHSPGIRGLSVPPGKQAGAASPVRKQPGSAAKPETAPAGFRRAGGFVPPIKLAGIRQQVAPAGFVVALAVLAISLAFSKPMQPGLATGAEYQLGYPLIFDVVHRIDRAVRSVADRIHPVIVKIGKGGTAQIHAGHGKDIARAVNCYV